MARTPEFIAAQQTERRNNKRKSAQVATQSDENNEEVFHKLLNMSHNLAKIATNTSKIQIDLSNILKMNQEISTLAKKDLIIKCNLSCVLSNLEESMSQPCRRKRVRFDTLSNSSSSESVSSGTEHSN